MLRKKVCMIGAPTVGKSSLVRRYVHGLFSESYLSTIGVKVDKKTIETEEGTVELMLWDIHGDDEFARIRPVYLRGSSGYLLVVDGTRRETLAHALELRDRTVAEVGELPFLLLLNKRDLGDDWAIEESDLEELRARELEMVETSAKLGDGVEEAFARLVDKVASSAEP